MENKAVQKKAKKPIFKKWWFWLVIIIVIVEAFVPNKGSDKNDSSTVESQPVESHIYDNAQVKDVINGSRTEKIGEYSIIEVNSEEVTDEALTDWYFNYVVPNDYNWCMILYTDKNDNSGVYAISGMIQKGIQFEKDKYGDYAVGDSSNATVYTPTNDNELQAMNFDN
ncbi:hypothetical protein [uncultured Gemmiger sp.]|uniref:hypothetical protein n=1 Tax=uncultured Gemmiger sp. TaxID=1623490 RepID=UPI0025EAFB00|nr:hypothetical protein [uncultured Gemmiger sp.]